MPEEIAYIRALERRVEELEMELKVYHEMQENLNTNLVMYPSFLDVIEDLQCQVYPPDYVPFGGEMATDIYDGHYRDVLNEVKRLHGEMDNQEQLISNQTLQLNAYEIAYEKLKQEQRNLWHLG